MKKWNGKKKALTFSFDDGVAQDLRVIEILDKYSLKATFNLNSARLGRKGTLERNGIVVDFSMISCDSVKSAYKSHEVAAHTLTHMMLPSLDDSNVIWQVEEDRRRLSELVGYEVLGMAYPCGGKNNDERVAKIIKENTGIRFARTISSTYNFDIQDNLYRFDPSVYIIEVDKLFELGREFIDLRCDTPKIFYIWGHAFEMDAEYISWEKFEEFCKLISGRDDIYYEVNSKVIL